MSHICIHIYFSNGCFYSERVPRKRRVYTPAGLSRAHTVRVPVTGTCTVWRSGSWAPEEERPTAAHTHRLWGGGGRRQEGATDKQTGRRQTRKQHPRWETLTEHSFLSRRSVCLNVTRFAVEPPYGRQISLTVTTVSAYASHPLMLTEYQDGSCTNNMIDCECQQVSWSRVCTPHFHQLQPHFRPDVNIRRSCSTAACCLSPSITNLHTPVCTSFPRSCPGACVDIAIQQQ